MASLLNGLFSGTSSIELRHLRYFLVVSEEGNISRAARKLNTSQPSLGKQMHDLEDRLGTDLFDRSGKRLLLTEPGKLLYARTKELMGEWSSLTNGLKEQDNTQMPRLLRLLTSEPVAASRPFANALHALNSRIPQYVTQVIDPAKDPDLLRLMDGEIDLICSTEIIHGKELEAVTIHTAPFNVALPADHPFSEGKAVTIQQLKLLRRINLTRIVYPLYRALIEGRLNLPAAESDVEVTHIATGLELVSRAEGCMITLGLDYPVLGRGFVLRPISDAGEVSTRLYWRRKSRIGENETILTALRQPFFQQADNQLFTLP
jgi:DNA-binding transcriptional LysR family regulator